MKKNIQRILLLTTVLIMLTSMFAGCGRADVAAENTLFINLQNVEASDGSLILTLTTVNNTGYDISLGWAGGCDIEVTTSDGFYCYTPFMTEIPLGESVLTVPIRQASGQVEKVVITCLYLLSDGNSNLPGPELKNVVVYDTSKNISGFSGSFTRSTAVRQPSGAVVILPIFGGSLIIAIFFMLAALVLLGLTIGGIVILVIYLNKKNKKAAQQFNPYEAKPRDAAPNLDDSCGFAPPPPPTEK